MMAQVGQRGLERGLQRAALDRVAHAARGQDGPVGGGDHRGGRGIVVVEQDARIEGGHQIGPLARAGGAHGEQAMAGAAQPERPAGGRGGLGRGGEIGGLPAAGQGADPVVADHRHRLGRGAGGGQAQLGRVHGGGRQAAQHGARGVQARIHPAERPGRMGGGGLGRGGMILGGRRQARVVLQALNGEGGVAGQGQDRGQDADAQIGGRRRPLAAPRRAALA